MIQLSSTLRWVMLLSCRSLGWNVGRNLQSWWKLVASSQSIDLEDNHTSHFCICIVNNWQLFTQVGHIVDNWQPFTQVGRIVDNWQLFTQVGRIVDNWQQMCDVQCIGWSLPLSFIKTPPGKPCMDHWSESLLQIPLLDYLVVTY